MRAALAFALGLPLLLAGPSGAQESAPREERCWIGGSTFSVGAAMRVGDAVARCGGAAGWVAPDAPLSAAGCLLDGELSSVGALVGVRNSDSLVLSCTADGQWVTLETEAQS